MGIKPRASARASSKMSSPAEELAEQTSAPHHKKSLVPGVYSTSYPEDSYLGDETERTLSKFVDSTKLERMIDTANSRTPIQRDLEKFEDGANRNSMESNKKCRIMHVGRHRAWHQSRLGTDELPGQTSLQHTLTLNNANLILGCTMMNKASRLQEVTTLTAQCWGGHVQFWAPKFKGNMGKAEMSQQRLAR
ncbi:mitochondrial enolase superfamily member 1 [Grus japonensis]|uniref:Mitochondrial enolase superfamily member 1 n=1 Tax=Grus japonensis TaxID=30415 RepID=A0ABC9XF20_GRUJA